MLEVLQQLGDDLFHGGFSFKSWAGGSSRRSTPSDESAYTKSVKIVLLSTYELGRQPFGLASPAAWLRTRGHDVACFDLSRQAMDDAAIRAAELIAIYLPMHTATRLASRLIPSLRESNMQLCARSAS
jgi:hypothetical protein